MLVIWLIPIRLYRLPVGLPFNLEPYRIAVLLLIFGLILGVMAGHLPLTAAGHGLALLALGGVAFASQAVNWSSLDIPGQPPVAFKTLSYFISFVAIFMLIAAAIQRYADARQIVSGVVIGGAIVAVAAMIESRTRSNLFENLDNWIPGLVKEPPGGARAPRRTAPRTRVGAAPDRPRRRPDDGRAARDRARPVRGDAGPEVPVAGRGGGCTMGALVTVSRTVVAMAVVMTHRRPLAAPRAGA